MDEFIRELKVLCKAHSAQLIGHDDGITVFVYTGTDIESADIIAVNKDGTLVSDHSHYLGDPAFYHSPQ